MTISEGTELERRCSVNNCPEPAVTSDSGEIGQWVIVIPYCAEHARELEEGTPLGSVGLDASRLEVRPREGTEPQPGGGRIPGID